MDPINIISHTMLSIPEVIRELRVSRSTVWRLAKEGKIPIVSIGRRKLVRRTDLAIFTNSLTF